VARVISESVGISGYIPWDRYADGQTWELTQGTDFTQDAERARAAVRAWARRRGWVAKTSVPAPGVLRLRMVRDRGSRCSA
jgi:hypothetical protein